MTMAHRLTADIRLRYAQPKSLVLLGTSYVRGTLSEITPHKFKSNGYINRMELRIKRGELNAKNKEI